MAVVLTNVRLSKELKDRLERGGKYRVVEADRASAADYSSTEILLLQGPQNWLTESRIASMPRLRFIQTVYAGLDDVDFSVIPKGVTVCGNVGAYARSMTEYVFGVVIFWGRDLSTDRDNLRNGVFQRRISGLFLDGKTLGVLGAGSVGSSVARVARSFGMKTFGMNTDGRPVANFDRVIGPSGVEQVLRESDVLVVSLPLTRRTENLLDAKRLGLMKDDSLLVNVGRAKIINEKALYDRLKAHRRFRAASDVWWVYPKAGERFAQHYPFLDLPNFFGSPHVSGDVEGSLPIAHSHAVRNIRRYIEGRSPMGAADKGDYARKKRSPSPP